MMISVDNINLYPLSGAKRYFLLKDPVDNRKSFNGLSAIVKEKSEDGPLVGDVYLFYIKRKPHIKVLFWCATGLTIIELPEKAGERLRCLLRIAEIDESSNNERLT